MFVVVVAVAAVLAAAETVPFLDFAKGPAQWIMTRDEQRAWRNVKTEEQARDFVDLFWARRDPTPGTPINEFRQDYESRIALADKRFKEGNRRGSLTDRGRVMLVLGVPASWNTEQEKRTSYQGSAAATSDAPALADPTGGRALAAKDIWTYSREQAQKFDVPKLEVVFLFDGMNGAARRDPLRPDFISALPAAIKNCIVSPDLTQVPDWASSRLRKPAAVTVAAESAVAESVTTTSVARTIVDKPAPVAKEAGAGRLTLLKDVSSLRPQGGSDPLASLESVGSFRRDDELGWTAEFCAGSVSPEAPPLKVQLRINGVVGGQKVNMSTEAEEYVPDSIKALPGCYLVRGSLPLTDVEAGSYTLTITIAGSREEQRYNLTREFRVE